MGYKPQKKVFRLRFEDEEYADLVIRVKSATMNDFMELTKLDKDKPDDSLKVFALFVRNIVSWNIEDDDDNPLPVTVESLLDLEPDFVNRLITTWMETTAGVSVPLGKPSNVGATAPTVSIPMEPLSSSQAS